MLAAGTGLKLFDFLGVFILISKGFCQEIKRCNYSFLAFFCKIQCKLY